ncbi:MAG: PIN domain-containing protein [Candidatus Limnocylindria bacterium]
MNFLVDTGILILRERHEAVRSWFAEHLTADKVATCDMVGMEYLMGARNGRHFDDLATSLNALHRVDVVPSDWRRASHVLKALAYQTGGGQRAVRIPDLLVAAVGERVAMPIAHYDEDYDRIAAVTGQQTLWVVPRGSL